MRSGIYLVKTSSHSIPPLEIWSIMGYYMGYLIFLQDGIVLDEKAKEA